jgi:nitrite reductase/ring-hydroxylating ferredoxin subunit
MDVPGSNPNYRSASMEHTDDLDFAGGIDIQEVADGAIIRGHVGGEKVLLVRRGEDYFAIGAECTHYHAQLANGLIVDDTIRCPMHHACFSLRTGEALCAPALDPVSIWRIERGLGKIIIREKLSPPQNRPSLHHRL